MSSTPIAKDPSHAPTAASIFLGPHRPMALGRRTLGMAHQLNHRTPWHHKADPAKKQGDPSTTKETPASVLEPVLACVSSFHPALAEEEDAGVTWYFASAHAHIPAHQPLPGPNRHTSHTRLAQSLVPKAHVSNNKKCGNSDDAPEKEPLCNSR